MTAVVSDRVLEPDRSIIFVDFESTGLTMAHEPIEIAWWTEGDHDENVYEIILPHTLVNAQRGALTVNNYHHRQLWDRSRWCGPEDIQVFADAIFDNTICSANTPFEWMMLTRLFGFPLPCHFRFLDFTSWAAGRMGLPTTVGMHATFDICVERGLDVVQGDHTAAGDVRSMRSIRRALL